MNIEKFVHANNDRDILRIGLKDKNDKPILDEKGEVVYWEFDLADIELPLKYNKCEAEHKKNQQNVRIKFAVIEKKQDKKGKYLLSSNEEEKLKALVEYYEAESKTLDLFLGEGGTRKFLNGRKPYWDMFDDISETMEPILPMFENTIKNITDKIKSKYSKKEDNVLE